MHWKSKPLPCLEWSLPISPHQTAVIKHQIGCNPTKPKRDFDPRWEAKRARGYIQHRARARVELWSPSRAHSPFQPRPLRPWGLPDPLFCCWVCHLVTSHCAVSLRMEGNVRVFVKLLGDDINSHGWLGEAWRCSLSSSPHSFRVCGLFKCSHLRFDTFSPWARPLTLSLPHPLHHSWTCGMGYGICEERISLSCNVYMAKMKASSSYR